MVKGLKKLCVGVCMLGIAVVVWGCGDEEKVEPQAPTKYINEAHDAVDENNERVDEINQKANSIYEATEE